MTAYYCARCFTAHMNERECPMIPLKFLEDDGCPHDERDQSGTCNDCGHESDGSGDVDSAHEYVQGER